MQRPYDPDLEGTVLNLQRFSVHDGPGIRTVVFLKGCSLRCLWCSNPESMARARQLGVSPARCIGIDKCGACLERAADRESLVVECNRVVGVTPGREVDALACAQHCPSGALKVCGEVRTVGSVMQEVLADRGFYEESGGGLTLSGGEAMVQAPFAVEPLKAAKAEGIGTCIETALNYAPSVLDAVLPYLDFALCDLKHLDPAAHERCTGASNRGILVSLRKLAQSGIPWSWSGSPSYWVWVWGSIFSFEGGRFFWKLPRRIPHPVTVLYGKPMPANSSPFEVRSAVQALNVEGWHYRREAMRPLARAFVSLARRHPLRFAMADARVPRLRFGAALTRAIYLARRLAPVWANQSMVRILLPPSVGGALVNWAAMLLGKVPVNLNYRASPDIIASCLRQCGIDGVVTSKAFDSSQLTVGHQTLHCSFSSNLPLLSYSILAGKTRIIIRHGESYGFYHPPLPARRC